jgi:hypothetical protein
MLSFDRTPLILQDFVISVAVVNVTVTKSLILYNSLQIM